MRSITTQYKINRVESLGRRIQANLDSIKKLMERTHEMIEERRQFQEELFETLREEGRSNDQS